ncbi:hypothetical protein KUTeg_016737 [Tegillarca granosa]|uniref:Uncharacterized protein n=1 Tax=Tegillarca granosa TaxID=220873 RepID=A0ABQ9ERL2_TEGGR|nr:hypothetical protein KUTeg_016737 [Tegillarca granosa]
MTLMDRNNWIGLRSMQTIHIVSCETYVYLTSKTALVTGGSQGIGKAIAECLVKEEARVYVIGRSKENLERIKAGNQSIFTIQRLGQNESICGKNWDCLFAFGFIVTQTVARALIAAGRPGAVVNISSVLAMKTSIPVTALELGPHGIRVNSINPTLIPTDMAERYEEEREFVQMFLKRHPLGKFASVEDVVNATLFCWRSMEECFSIKCCV